MRPFTKDERARATPTLAGQINFRFDSDCPRQWAAAREVFWAAPARPPLTALGAKGAARIIMSPPGDETMRAAAVLPARSYIYSSFWRERGEKGMSRGYITCAERARGSLLFRAGGTKVRGMYVQITLCWDACDKPLLVGGRGLKSKRFSLNFYWIFRLASWMWILLQKFGKF